MTPRPIPKPRESGYTQSTTVPLYWCRYGSPGAPKLLVLHGGPGADHGYLLPHFLDLADEFELILYDQRGGGRSRTDDLEPITWHTQVDDLASVTAELLDSTPPVVVGYSWGALLGMLYAIEATRGRVAAAPSRIALVSPAPISRAHRKTFEATFAARSTGPAIQAMRAQLAASGLRDRDPIAHKQRAFELSVAGYFADPTQARNLTPFRVTGRVQTQVWESLGDFDLAPALATVHVPSLVLHGRQDPIPLESSEAAARALRSNLIVLEDCGHVPYVEARSALFSALRTFLHGAP